MSNVRSLSSGFYNKLLLIWGIRNMVNIGCSKL